MLESVGFVEVCVNATVSGLIQSPIPVTITTSPISATGILESLWWDVCRERWRVGEQREVESG